MVRPATETAASSDVSIRVVNIKTSINGYEYIGRGNQWKGLRASPLANRFRIGFDGDRDEVIAKYEVWLRGRIHSGDREVLDELARLASIVVRLGHIELACFCAPQACHGDVIKAAIEEILADQEVA